MEWESIYRISEWVGLISVFFIMLYFCYSMHKLDEDPKDRRSIKKLKAKRS